MAEKLAAVHYLQGDAWAGIVRDGDTKFIVYRCTKDNEIMTRVGDIFIESEEERWEEQDLVVATFVILPDEVDIADPFMIMLQSDSAIKHFKYEEDYRYRLEVYPAQFIRMTEEINS